MLWFLLGFVIVIIGGFVLLGLFRVVLAILEGILKLVFGIFSIFSIFDHND